MSDLRDTVRKALVGHTGDPRDLVDDVIAQLPDDLIREALRETLPNYVRLVQSSVQRPTRQQVKEILETPEATVDALPDMTVFARGVWKPLADCDADDLSDMAGRRDTQAAGNTTFAELYRHIARNPSPPQLSVGASLEVLTRRRDQLRSQLESDVVEARAGLNDQLRDLRRKRDQILHDDERDTAIFRLAALINAHVTDIHQQVEEVLANG